MQNAVSWTGKKLNLPGVEWKASRINAVVFLSTHCHYCDASMPFYRRLASVHKVSNSPINLIAISPEPVDVVQRHLADEQVEFDHVYQIKLPNPMLNGTPTTFLVDDNGSILQARIGKLNSSEEDEIERIVQTGKLDSTAGIAGRPRNPGQKGDDHDSTKQ